MNEQFGWNLFVLPVQHEISFFGPFLAAFFTVLIFNGFSGVGSFLKASFLPRASLWWYLFAIVVPVVFFLIAQLIQRMVIGYWFILDMPWIEWLGIWLFWLLLSGIGEETGWRGFALSELQMKFSWNTSALIVTLVWMLWHLPYFFAHPGFMNMDLFMIGGWLVSLFFVSFLLCWLFNQSGQNVWIPVLWQGTYNAVINGTNEPTLIPSLVAAMAAVLSIIVFILQLKKWPAKQKYARGHFED